MAYEQFAYLYDQLMKDSPYPEWEALLKRRMDTYGSSGQRLLDIGCGTGELTIKLALAGFSVAGVDLSSDMLAIADQKASDHHISIPFYEQDMRRLSLPEKYDIAVIFCDSLNYLETIEEVIETFQRVHDHLNDNGLFVFDVHSLHKINNLFKNHDFIYNEEDISYIWECFEGPLPNSVYHDLTFFVRLKSGLYEKIDESHIQTAWNEDELLQSLDKAGFRVVNVSADFSDDHPLQISERLFFTAKKK